MSKQFIKIKNQHVPKNKFQKLVQESLSELEGVLVSDFKTAQKLIQIAYKDAIDSYNGSAKVLELKSFKNDENQSLFYVDDVIYLSVYGVKNDLTIINSKK